MFEGVSDDSLHMERLFFASSGLLEVPIGWLCRSRKMEGGLGDCVDVKGEEERGKTPLCLTLFDTSPRGAGRSRRVELLDIAYGRCSRLV